ncbi:MAG: Fur family transcriptional regulator [Defluviicoccus sp.]|nr:Fur family transcriptional regulator [Defluviicoccus sp.]
MNSLQERNVGFLSDQHDHGDCVASALEDAIAVCGERGVRLTPVRRRVLEIIWQGHRPLGAYAILDVLSGEGHSPAPPTVYRALEFLLTQGLVHRLSSLNAYVGCSRPGHPGAGQFLLCTACGTAAELNDPGIERAIERGAAAEGFVCRDHTVEISGLCPHCREA